MNSNSENFNFPHIKKYSTLTSTDQRDVRQRRRVEQVGEGRRQVRRVVAPFEAVLLLIHRGKGGCWRRMADEMVIATGAAEEGWWRIQLDHFGCSRLQRRRTRDARKKGVGSDGILERRKENLNHY